MTEKEKFVEIFLDQLYFFCEKCPLLKKFERTVAIFIDVVHPYFSLYGLTKSRKTKQL